MTRILTEEAFHFYVSLGDARCYRLVADRFGVSVRAVTKYAAKAEWPRRLADIERHVRENLDEQLRDELVEANQRHLKVFKFVQARAIEAMKTHPMTNVTEALRAYVLTLDRERLIRGEPSERVEHKVEDLTKREIRRLVGTVDEPEDLDDDSEDDDDDAGAT